MRRALLLLAIASVCLAQPKIGAVVNAANYGRLSFNSLVTIFGSDLSNGSAQAGSVPLPTTLAGAAVSACRATDGSRTIWLDCVPMPLIYASPTQINAVLPDSPGSYVTVFTASFIVSRTDGASAPVSAEIYPVAPGIFRMGYDCSFPAACALSGNGGEAKVGRGSIVDAKGALVSSQNPMRPGQYYSVYLTGLGLHTFPGLVNPPEFDFFVVGTNGVTSFTSYVGPAPGFAGLFQMNVMLPADLLRAFGDGVNLPKCSAVQDIKAEIAFVINDGSRGLSDRIGVPVDIRKGELRCTP